MQIHIAVDGRQEGPLDLEEINARIRGGALQAESTQAWFEGCDGWRPLEEVLAIAKADGTNVQQVPASSSFLVVNETAKPRLSVWEMLARGGVWLAVLVFAVSAFNSALDPNAKSGSAAVATLFSIVLFRRLLRLRCEAVAARYGNAKTAPLYLKGYAQALWPWFALFLATFVWGSAATHSAYGDGKVFGACLAPFIIGVLFSADVPFRMRRKLGRELPLGRPYANVAWIAFLALTVALFVWGLSHPSNSRHSRAAGDGWIAFTSPGGDFTVSAPGRIAHKSELLKTAAGTLTLHTYSLNRENQGMFAVETMDFPRNVIDRADPNRLLDGARNGALAMSKTVLVSESDVVRGSVTGREIHTRSADGKVSLTMQIFVVGVRSYFVITASPKANDPAARRFIDSFRLN
jgi:hypothetical protein